MHTPKADPRPSLYYLYRVYSPWLPSSAKGQPQSCAVAIVGAGPAGMVTAVAQAIDRVGPDKAPLFLVKLALLNAQALGAAEPFLAHIDSAGQDL